MDDRKRKELHDQLEKEKRQAHAAAASQAEPATPSSLMTDIVMPGSGHILGTPHAEDDEQMTSMSHGPPPYEDLKPE